MRTIEQHAQALAGGSTTSRALVEQCLGRIADPDGEGQRAFIKVHADQARAMAEKNYLSHEVLGSFSRRISPSKAGRAAENIAYGYESFEKTLGQWIDSSEHRKNLLLARATRIGIASAKDASGKRTYWAMEIAGDYEPKPPQGQDKGKKGGERLIAGAKEEPVVKREVVAAKKPAASKCHISLLGLCL